MQFFVGNVIQIHWFIQVRKILYCKYGETTHLYISAENNLRQFCTTCCFTTYTKHLKNYVHLSIFVFILLIQGEGACRHRNNFV
jgi:hypothetical protein